VLELYEGLSEVSVFERGSEGRDFPLRRVAGIVVLVRIDKV
jgi:hypothetical protein